MQTGIQNGRGSDFTHKAQWRSGFPVLQLLLGESMSNRQLSYDLRALLFSTNSARRKLSLELNIDKSDGGDYLLLGEDLYSNHLRQYFNNSHFSRVHNYDSWF